MESVSDSITSEEQVEIPEETSGITSSSEQVDAPVIQENVIEGFNSVYLVTYTHDSCTFIKE